MKVIIFDNEGETLDRYTILNTKTGDLFGCSEDPFHPLGVGVYSHNVADSYHSVTYGYAWRERLDVNKCIKSAVNNWINEFSNGGLGRRVTYQSLPEKVKKYIKETDISFSE